ncbi:pentapeptide repeat-containing protein [Kamptonema formosum]|uniref:pentapeptide repeat-containing protein n=1 Tax=Kamptonema formosum TaxID=331992 RepID=UPI0003448B09|nr:pentapeptide repeat-containing protein [Oscillatoria sp. PCC 10802]
MPVDFSGQNLQGRNFKNQDLTGANFAHSDIRGANFTGANLTGANLTGALAGVPRRQTAALAILPPLLASLSGLLATLAGAFAGALLNPQFIKGNTIFPGVAVLLLLALFFLVTLRRGMEAGLWAVAVVAAVAGASAGLKPWFLAWDWALTGIWEVAGMAAWAWALALAGAASLAAGGGRAWAITGALAWFWGLIGAALGTGAGFLGGLFQDAWASTAVWAFAVCVAVGVGCGWASRRALSGDERFAAIGKIAVAFATAGGTSFRRADLTDVNFSQAVLKKTDFRKANLTRTCWLQARELDRARLGNSILANPAIRDLLVSGSGRNKSYAGINLRGANLAGADLSHADLRETNLTEASLQGACLKSANLSASLASGADLSSAELTGALIGNWKIDSNTRLDGVICEYVYLLNFQVERRPLSGEFAPGEFAQLFQPAFNSVDLVFRTGMNWQAFLHAFNQVRSENTDAELSLQSVEQKADSLFAVQLRAAAGINKAKIHQAFCDAYQSWLEANAETSPEDRGVPSGGQDAGLISILTQLAAKLHEEQSAESRE